MNETIRTQLGHRSIRAFTQMPLSAADLQILLDVANRAPSSNGMQSFSIIRVTDSALRQAIAAVSAQDYVMQVPEFWVFLADAHRNQCIAAEQGVQPEAAADTDRFFQGLYDALIAAQNVALAAESMGLGTVFFGSILNDSARMVELLNLPTLTFPAVGLGIGHAAQDPALKPRIKPELKVFENTYMEPDSYLAAISDYDEEMQHYYDLRDSSKPVGRYSLQVLEKLSQSKPKRNEILAVARAQGFRLN